MTLILYSVPVSLYSAKLKIVLRHKGLAWDEVAPPGGYGSAEYKTVVPSGNIPALRDGDLLLADSEAIAEYLEEAHPEPPMLPRGIAERAKARERSRFHDTRLEPEIRALFPHMAPANRDADFVTAKAAAINTRLVHFAAMLADRPDNTLTLGDCGFPVAFEWIEAFDTALGLGIDWPGAVRTYREALGQHAAVTTELTSYRPAIAGWIASRL